MSDINKTIDGKKIYLYRGSTKNADLSSSEYSPEANFRVGLIQNNTFIPIPLANGTVNLDGSSTLNGSEGGSNTTSNTEIYKPGGGVSDDTAQNLIVNTTVVDKKWSSSLTNNIDTSKYGGLWLYFSEVFDFIESIEIRLKIDASNYYSKNVDLTVLNSEWNWIDFGLISSMIETGTVSTSPDTLEIIITTEDATDVWDDGDVVFDLLRTFTEADTYKTFVTGYPITDLTNVSVTKQAYISASEGIGFSINGFAEYNDDSVKLNSTLASISNRGISSANELLFTSVDRIV